MQTLFILLFSLFFPIAALALTEAPDTIVVYDTPGNSLFIEEPDTLVKVKSPSQIIITESAKGSVVTVRGAEEDDAFETSVVADYPVDASVTSRQSIFTESVKSVFSPSYSARRSRSGKGYWSYYFDGVCLGLTKATSMEGDPGLQWSKSFEISWLSCFGISYEYRNFSLSLGLGFLWRNYKITTSDKCLVVGEDRGLEWGSYPEGSSPKNSRLKTFALQFPLLGSWRIPHTSLLLKAGPILDVNTYGSVKTVYRDAAGKKCSDFTKSVKYRSVTLDLFGSLAIRGGLGIYVRYSPMKVIDNVGSLNFKPFTLGFLLSL